MEPQLEIAAKLLSSLITSDRERNLAARLSEVRHCFDLADAFIEEGNRRKREQLTLSLRPPRSAPEAKSGERPLETIVASDTTRPSGNGPSEGHSAVKGESSTTTHRTGDSDLIADLSAANQRQLAKPADLVKRIDAQRVLRQRYKDAEPPARPTLH